jgi:hypothetical protein
LAISRILKPKNKMNMKNLIKYGFIAVVMLSFMRCNNGYKELEKPPTKPFIVTYKFPDGSRCGSDWCSYEYTDDNGNSFHFCEDEVKYNVGDTLN